MATTGTVSVNYVVSARRHFNDANILLGAGNASYPNAGQLFGFTVECGLKALLLACGVTRDADGGVPGRFRTHMPTLSNNIVTAGTLIPDGARSAHYHALLPSLHALSDWKVDHRYFIDSALPLSSLPNWQLAAKEITEMIDQAIADGVL